MAGTLFGGIDGSTDMDGTGEVDGDKLDML